MATALQQWLTDNKMSIMGLARTLGVSRGRTQFWVHGYVMPRGPMLEKVMTLTGLPVTALFPDPHKQELRRLRERARLLALEQQSAKPRRRAVKAKAAPRTKAVAKKGALTKRSPRRGRATRH